MSDKPMKCKCGGELIRIAIDCYQCNTCGLKQAAALQTLTLNTIKITPNVLRPDVEELQKSICEALGVSGRLFNKQ